MELGINDTAHCGLTEGCKEDCKIGNCLNYLNVTAGSDRDEKGLERFFALTPEDRVRGFNEQ